MKCDDLLVALCDYFDGDLPGPLCVAVEEHLLGCDACRIVLVNIRQTIRLFRADAAAMPGGVHERLLGAFAGGTRCKSIKSISA